MRNLACKVPEDLWPEFKVQAQVAYQAPSRAIARYLAGKLETGFGRSLPSAVPCFLDDFEACIAHLRMPVNHRRAIRTTNLLERLFVEERRRMKIIPKRLGQEGGAEADVRGADPGIGTLAPGAGLALRETADGGVGKGARRGTPERDRTRSGSRSRGTHPETVPQKSDLTRAARSSG